MGSGKNRKDKYWTIVDQEVWKGGLYMDPWEWAQSVKIFFASHINVHQGASWKGY